MTSVVTLLPSSDAPQRTLRNPIIPGFNPDPAIVRRGADYYIATSTFEWFPAVQLHHSRDLASWRLIGHALTGDEVDLRGVPASGGVWAPCLTVDPDTGRFFLVFSVMKSQVAEVFDVDNYICWADEITGPWSAPLYVNSIGFDSSLFHDDDGSKWLLTLEWETRPGHEHPGYIVAQTFDDKTGHVGPPVRIHHGTTDRGAMEAPHMYKHDGVYYLMTAEGGTGFGHGVCLARSTQILGPYEPDPESPFITSSPAPYSARGHRDFLRPERLYSGTELHKAGHGSLVEAADGSWWVAHLSARLLPDEPVSLLGRETSLQAVEWSPDGWLRMKGGGNLAQDRVPLVAGPPDPGHLDLQTDFADGLSPHFAVPRGPIEPTWCRPTDQGLRLRGRDSLHSLLDVSLVATRRRSFVGSATTLVSFDPTHFSHAAGLTLFYNNRNFLAARVTHDESTGGRVLELQRAEDGSFMDEVLERVHVPDGDIGLRLSFSNADVRFHWRPKSGPWQTFGSACPTSYMSDEKLHGFTGQFVGLFAADGLQKSNHAVFRQFSLTYTDA